MNAPISSLTANWNYPTAVKAGPGRIRELPKHCQDMGMKRPLLVTDPGLAPLPIVTGAVQACRDAGLDCGLFSGIKGNPTGRNVEDGVAAFRAGKHDGVIAFGGGSALDAAKAIALMVGQSRPLWDFEDVGDNYLRVNVQGMAPVIAVPTTAGTGSEVGRASVITDDEAHVKRIIFHARMLPALVILDAELTAALPSRLTAATGMDATAFHLARMDLPEVRVMAELYPIDQIFDNAAYPGLLANALIDAGIPALTPEIGRPRILDHEMIGLFVEGTMNVIKHHGILSGPMGRTGKDSGVLVADAMFPVIATHGGFVELLVELKQAVKAGQKLAIQRNTFGEIVAEYTAPRDGEIGARRTDATAEPGTPILFALFDSATPSGGDVIVE